MVAGIAGTLDSTDARMPSAVVTWVVVKPLAERYEEDGVLGLIFEMAGCLAFSAVGSCGSAA